MLIAITLAVTSESARILAVFPIPSISHQVVFRPFTLELAKRGHEVVVITTDPIFEKGKTPANFTEIDVHDSYKIWREEFPSMSVTKGEKDDLLTQVSVAFHLLTKIFESQMAMPQVQRVINDTSLKFDLLIIEACIQVALGLTHVYKNVPVIQISSFTALPHNSHAIGIPIHPIATPTVLRQRIYNLSNWEKLIEIYNFIQLEIITKECEEEGDKMLKRVIGPDVPTIHELRNNVDLLFLNMYPIWDLNKPVPPNVIHVGGLYQNPIKELPEVSGVKTVYISVMFE